jgi:hypothetical protein
MPKRVFALIGEHDRATDAAARLEIGEEHVSRVPTRET